MSNVDNMKDIIDSRDIIARIEELEFERTSLVDSVTNAEDTLTDARDITSALSPEEVAEAREDVADAEEALSDWDDDNKDELDTLQALAEEGEGSPDWSHGESLIRDSYFEEYAMDFAEEIGAVDSGACWPNTCIDWKQAAEELQQDYFSVDFDGVDYWIRS